MRITPIEIQQQQFKSRLFGYDTASVDQFLEIVAEELERLHRHNNELKENLARTAAALEQMRDREKSLQQTLVTAQQVSEDMKANARKEAEIVLAEAHLEADRIIQDADRQRIALLEEIQGLKRQKITFEVGLRALLENHMQLLNLDMLEVEEDDQQKLLHDSFSLDEIEASLNHGLSEK